MRERIGTKTRVNYVIRVTQLRRRLANLERARRYLKPRLSSHLLTRMFDKTYIKLEIAFYSSCSNSRKPYTHVCPIVIKAYLEGKICLSRMSVEPMSTQNETNGISTEAGLPLDEAVDGFEQTATMNRRESSVKSYVARLTYLTEWCEDNGIQTVEGLKARTLRLFCNYVREHGDLSESYKSNIITAVRVFIQELGKDEVLPKDRFESVESYTPDKSDRVSDNYVEIDRVDSILNYFETHYPFSRDLAILRLLAQTGMRTTALHSLDLKDVCLDESERPEIRVRHRPDTGTTLKRGEDHERNIPLRKETFDLLMGYVKHHRTAVEDDYGRKPLFTSRHGRLNKQGIQRTAYMATCPATVGKECEEHDSRPARNKAFCEGSEGPHAFGRKSAITRWLNEGHTIEQVSLLCAVSTDVIETNYDKGTYAQKSERTRPLLEAFDS